MHVIDVLLDSFTRLFRHHTYSPLEKLYSVILFIAGPNAIKFLKMVLQSCDGKPIVVVDRGPWYRWALERLEITYFHETFGNRNKIERWFRELKNRTKRFYNNVNSKTLKSIEELVTAIAIMHNIIRAGGEEVIPT
jgi:transposase-like protein